MLYDAGSKAQKGWHGEPHNGLLIPKMAYVRSQLVH